MNNSSYETSVNAVVGTNGTVTFDFPQPYADQVWTGSVTIPGAVPATVDPIQWQALDVSTPLGIWYNNQPSGVLQVQRQLIVIGSGITPGKLTAYFDGITSDVSGAPNVWPEPTPPPPAAGPLTLLPFTTFPIAANGSVQVVTNQPVVVGSGLTIWADTNQSGTRVIVQWGSGINQVVEKSYDYSTQFPVYGWNCINLDSPVNVFLKMNALGGTGFAKVLTGGPGVELPPAPFSHTTPPPAGGDPENRCLAYQAMTFVPGNNPFALPSYYGDVIVSAQMTAPATPPLNDLEVSVSSINWVGASMMDQSVQATYVSNPGALVVAPTRMVLPRAINNVTVINRTGVNQSGFVQVTCAGL